MPKFPLMACAFQIPALLGGTVAGFNGAFIGVGIGIILAIMFLAQTVEESAEK